MVDLLPCPFCSAHNEDVIIAEVGRYRKGYCLKCGASGPITETAESAVLSWNTRPSY